MLNDGRILRNKTKIKPVACDMLDELTKLKDRTLAEDDNADDLWVDLFKEDFENEDTTPKEKIELLVNFLYTVGRIKDDIPVTDPECMKADGGDFYGYEMLDDNIPYYGFTVESYKTRIRVYKLLFFNGEDFQIFTPFNGNMVNVIARTALSNENMTRIHFAKALRSDFAVEIYGEELTPEQVADVDTYACRYVNYFEPDIEFNGKFSGEHLEPDYEAIDKEIWSAIDK